MTKEDFASQLTKTQALLEVECKDYIEKEKKSMVEVDSLHQSLNWQQSMSSYVCTEALDMQTLHVLASLSDAIQ